MCQSRKSCLDRFYLPSRTVMLFSSGTSFNKGNQHQECLAPPSFTSIYCLLHLLFLQRCQLLHFYHCDLRYFGNKMCFFLYIFNAASARVTPFIYIDALHRLRHIDYSGVVNLFLADFTLL